MATTLCDEPVSTSKLRRGPAGEADRHAEATSPCADVTVTGTVVPSPSVRPTGGGPIGPVYGVAAVTSGPSTPGTTSAPASKSMRTAPKRERTSEPSSPIGSPFPPIWGSVAAVSCCGARVTPSSDHEATETGRAVPVQPTPANCSSGPADAR